MKILSLRTKALSLFMVGLVLLSSCSSSTVIQSKPSGAQLYVDGQSVGTTPYTHTDTKIIGGRTLVRMEMEGYEPLFTSFARDEQVDPGAIVGGIFFLVPFLWTMKYYPGHTYELRPISDTQQQSSITKPQNNSTKSKAERLREFKQLLDENAITQEEYEKEKKKILEEE